MEEEYESEFDRICDLIGEIESQAIITKEDKETLIELRRMLKHLDR